MGIRFAFAFCLVISFSGFASGDCESLLRVVSLNTQNLVIRGLEDPEFKYARKDAKKEWQLRGMAEAATGYRPDVMVLQELESKAQAEYWNEKYLDGQFNFLSTRVRDERGILTGFMVSKRLSGLFDFAIESHFDELWTNPASGEKEKIFNRDLPVLWARSKESRELKFAIVGVHLKSKRDRPGDPESVHFRSEQVRRLLGVANQILAEHGPDFPVIIAGDFNDDLTYGAEAGHILASGFVDSVMVARPNAPTEELVTFSFFSFNNVAHGKLDGILLPQQQAGRVRDAGVLYYFDETGWPLMMPRNISQKRKQPSDHRPVGAAIELK